ncbi:MAG TPA: peptidoglycan-associated lipoprotein Pal [Pseudomonadales bacterium]
MDVEEVEQPVKQLVTVYYFEFDKSTLTAETRSNLNAVAAELKKNTNAVRLEGHADERGTREYNLALGERRAKAVADYLALQGVNKSRIEVISYGEEKPVAMGSTEAALAKNRRVELIK